MMRFSTSALISTRARASSSTARRSAGVSATISRGSVPRNRRAGGGLPQRFADLALLGGARVFDRRERLGQPAMERGIEGVDRHGRQVAGRGLAGVALLQ